MIPDTTPPVDDQPIIVNSSSLPAVAALMLRHLAQIAAGYLIAKGALPAGTDTEFFVGLVLGIAALGYGIFKAKRNNAVKVTLAEIVPDTVAKVK